MFKSTAINDYLAVEKRCNWDNKSLLLLNDDIPSPWYAELASISRIVRHGATQGNSLEYGGLRGSNSGHSVDLHTKEAEGEALRRLVLVCVNSLGDAPASFAAVSRVDQ